MFNNLRTLCATVFIIASTLYATAHAGMATLADDDTPKSTQIVPVGHKTDPRSLHALTDDCVMELFTYLDGPASIELQGASRRFYTLGWQVRKKTTQFILYRPLTNPDGTSGGFLFMPPELQRSGHQRHLSLLPKKTISSLQAHTETMEGIMGFLRGVPGLKGLSVHHTLHDDDLGSTWSLGQGLWNLPHLRELDLSQNRLTNYDLLTLMNAFQRLSNLRSLSLAHNNLGPESLPRVAQVLGLLPHLRQLDLSHVFCYQGGDTKTLAAALSTLTRLTKLNLSSMGMYAGGLEDILPSVLNMPHLRHLSLADNGLDNRHISCLRSILPQIPDLQTLEIGQNDFEDRGILHLGHILRQMPGLPHLSLYQSDFLQDDTIHLMMISLSRMTGLQSLSFELCEFIPHQTVRHLIPDFQCLPTLQYVNFSQHHFTPEDTQALAQAFATALPHVTVDLTPHGDG